MFLVSRCAGVYVGSEVGFGLSSAPVLVKDEEQLCYFWERNSTHEWSVE